MTVPSRTLRRDQGAGKAARRTAALALAAALVLEGCTAPKDQASEVPNAPSASAPVPSDVDPALAEFYTQSLEWATCEAGQCATVEVPVDYAKPDGKTIEIAIARRVASGDKDDRIGSLLINPGGPGASGISLLSSVPFLFG